jgi:hypothetical protein
VRRADKSRLCGEVLAPARWEYIMNKHRVKDNLSIRVINDHNEVHAINDELRTQLGELYYAISKSYLYSLISRRTGYCPKRIAYILNHTKMSEMPTA